MLADKKIFVIPDILANAGGVTVSYFEWVQDRQGFFWNEQLVNGRLDEIMVNSFNDVVGYADKAQRAQPPGRVHASHRSSGRRTQNPRRLCLIPERIARLRPLLRPRQLHPLRR